MITKVSCQLNWQLGTMFLMTTFGIYWAESHNTKVCYGVVRLITVYIDK